MESKFERWKKKCKLPFFMATFDGSDELKIPDALLCVICLDRPKEAHLCRFCSKLCCFECFTKWLTEHQNQCPHCRAVVILSDFVKFHWGEEVTEIVMKNQETIKNKSSTIEELTAELERKEKTVEDFRQRIIEKEENRHYERCKNHCNPITVYCNKCNVRMCNETALWSLEHVDHRTQLQPIGEACEEKMEQARKDLSQLRESLAAGSNKIKSCEENILKCKEESIRFTEVINKKMDSILKGALKPLERCKGRFVEETDEISKVIANIESLLEDSPMASLEKFPELARSAHDLTQNPTDRLVPSELPEFSKLLSLPYESRLFILKRFSKLRENGGVVESGYIYFRNYTIKCHLNVYPNGNGSARDKYLSVYLRFKSVTGSFKPQKYQYRIEMINQAWEKSLSHSNYSEESCDLFKPGSSRGYSDFYKLDSLQSDGFHDLKTDTVMIIFQVREELN